MKQFMWIVALAVVCLAFSGCASKPEGSREYKPGVGWVPA